MITTSNIEHEIEYLHLYDNLPDGACVPSVDFEIVGKINEIIDVLNAIKNSQK